ncbi:MAG: SGNH/GDSL hydrolase family protein [Bacteroidota bacterium]
MTDLPFVNTDTMPAAVKKYQYLALGDSYTIGESVAMQDNFPNQAASMMKTDTSAFETRIIARTGWTTDELEAGIIAVNNTRPLLAKYDFVSLLIGVNNQYRGRSVNNYKTEFEELLKKAMQYAGNRPERVVVLSIPDWGVTPFAEGRDRARIASEIDAYNAANKEIAFRYNINYIEITAWTREAAADPSLLAPDGLHPSGKEYRRWAERVFLFFKSKL